MTINYPSEVRSAKNSRMNMMLANDTSLSFAVKSIAFSILERMLEVTDIITIYLKINKKYIVLAL